jgi:hypothetical protein
MQLALKLLPIPYHSRSSSYNQHLLNVLEDTTNVLLYSRADVEVRAVRCEHGNASDMLLVGMK